jgi:hypothetical protein
LQIIAKPATVQFCQLRCMGTVPVNVPDFTRSRARRFKCDLLTIGEKPAVSCSWLQAINDVGAAFALFADKAIKGSTAQILVLSIGCA